MGTVHGASDSQRDSEPSATYCLIRDPACADCVSDQNKPLASMDNVLTRVEGTTETRGFVVEAVPGAGKTWLLIQAWRKCSGTTLILAYNSQLAKDLRAQGAPCTTFHSLCTRCLDVARDDAQLESAVLRAERGELVPKDVPLASHLFVDEVQDSRRIYIRLLKVLGIVRQAQRGRFPFRRSLRMRGSSSSPTKRSSKHSYRENMLLGTRTSTGGPSWR